MTRKALLEQLFDRLEKLGHLAVNGRGQMTVHYNDETLKTIKAEYLKIATEEDSREIPPTI